jgi:hypothetical protein
MNAPRFGYLVDGVDEAERQTRFRVLQALALGICGPRAPLTASFGKAINDPAAAETALALLVALPALRRRRLLASFSTLLPPGAKP